MNCLDIYAAQPTGGFAVRPVRITIKEPVPPTASADSAGADQRQTLFTEEAAHLEEALRNALPGGTYDALFARMAARKASALVVAHDR